MAEREGSLAYFDNVASRWDAMRTGFFSESLRAKSVDAASVLPGSVAADIGAGTGFVTEALLERGARVLAVDQSPEMLDAMKKKFGESAVRYLQGESENLPIPPATVDHVFANMYLHHVERPPAAIAEMARILKPGGTIVITDLDEHQFEFLRTEQHDRWMGFKRNDVIQWFKEAGLAEVRIDCADENCCADSTRGRERAEVSIFLAFGRKGAAIPPAR